MNCFRQTSAIKAEIKNSKCVEILICEAYYAVKLSWYIIVTQQINANEMTDTETKVHKKKMNSVQDMTRLKLLWRARSDVNNQNFYR